jgi:hypothetical protein
MKWMSKVRYLPHVRTGQLRAKLEGFVLLRILENLIELQLGHGCRVLVIEGKAERHNEGNLHVHAPSGTCGANKRVTQAQNETNQYFSQSRHED